MRSSHVLTQGLWRFFLAEDGVTLPLIALSLLALVGVSGAAIDVARMQLVQAKLSASMDAAGLAAGATLNTADTSAEVNKYLTVNFPAHYLGSSTPTASVTLSGNNMIINITGSTTIQPMFMQLLGVNKLTVSASSQISRTATGLEVVMVLDNTGSMAQSGKIAALKTAATTLVNILYGGQTSVPNLWIGLVPFSQTVNVGSSRTGWMDSTYANTLNWGPTSWGGCVEARVASGRDITDDPPSLERFHEYYWPSDSNNTWMKVKNGHTTYSSPLDTSTQGPNLNCPEVVTPMTADKTTILNAINSMQVRGDTLISYGMVWGWRMISPRWRGLWGGEMDTNNLPLDYHAPHMNKAVILLTDGVNTIDNNVDGAYGYLSDGLLGTTNSAQALTVLNNKVDSVCTAMKSAGIYVYTISLGSGTTAQVKTMLKNCATAKNYYFDSPSSGTLQGVFSAIADSLANLRVSQ